MEEPLGLRFVRRFSFLWDAVWVPFYLRAHGVELSPGCAFSGFPVVSRAPGSTIRMGRETRILSRNFATALGVAHPLVLRTLKAGATIEIGAKVGISGGSICAAQGVWIGDETLLGADVLVMDTDFHPISPSARHASSPESLAAQPVRIGKNVFVGARSMILKGVEIGDHSVIGAGSVVTRSVPAGMVAAGNPCRMIGPLT